MPTPQLDVDFRDPALAVDPFPMLEEIRAAGRVVWNGSAHAWMVPGYDDCTAVLTDTHTVQFSVPGALRPDVYFWFEAPAISITEGADHRRLRGPMARHFAATSMQRDWEPRVRGIVDQLLRPLVDGRDHFDIDDFTRIPVIVVAELLGVPEDRHDDFRRWSNVLVGNVAFGNEAPEAHRAMEAVVAEAKNYLSEEIARHRRERPDDLLTVMVDVADWSDAEIRAVALNLLLAGYDTTAKLLGLALVALEQHPAQRRQLVEDPSLIPSAVEEVLRWQSPTQAIVRVVVRDTELAGTRFEKGDVIYAMLGAANRDPSRWPDPQRFDIGRELKAHLAFTTGRHVCIGAALARLEARVALEALLATAPEYRLHDIDYGDAFFARGPVGGVINVGVPATT
ncbi:cytochrome P450 [Mycobacterium arosiense]|uniref:Cytochrome n=1 Tax=Mycobacterium arosiense ATCC BAA-1401 = DSM 45069 TaxID=1265311 RepID=A0A1W9ZNT8_MYCAI|nr:cytochrome P450 [Mycobacterium arosiense]ORA19479.1 hypothetical protein BST14_05405 [Mycobacterium arosiense ATCC BAA-1401 = DSM 45069]